MLANERQIAPSTHNQALSAILCFYREVLGIDLLRLNGSNRPAQKKPIPSVLTRGEADDLMVEQDYRLSHAVERIFRDGKQPPGHR